METSVSEHSRKEVFKLSEVCQHTDTQPYVLRFWESEFPQLGAKSGGGPRLYRQEDIDLVRRIKQLLYEEEYTLAGARKRLDDELGLETATAASATKPRRGGSTERGSVATPAEPEAVQVAPETTASPELDSVPRQRYQDAVDEIDHLRLMLKDAEREWRKAEGSVERSRREADEQRKRADTAVECLEQLLSLLE